MIPSFKFAVRQLCPDSIFQPLVTFLTIIIAHDAPKRKRFLHPQHVLYKIFHLRRGTLPAVADGCGADLLNRLRHQCAG